jgi:hypothetical protein
MKKLSLRIEELRIESFSTVAGASRRGTVRAHSDGLCGTYDGGCSYSTCLQLACGCTEGGPMETCGITICNTCVNPQCQTTYQYPTGGTYPGCC